MKIFLDTDIGDDIDDAFALRFLSKRQEIELLGVTTVYKNAAQRAKIAKRLLLLAGRGEIPVHAGANKPLKKAIRLLHNEKIEENGLIDIDHYTRDIQNETYEGDNASAFLLETLKKHPKEVTIVAIGPLTNLAQAILADKETFSLAEKILIMGGRFNEKIAEWNIEIDPDAAKIVFGCGVPVTCVSFDATKKTSMTRADVEKINGLSAPADQYLAQMMNRWIEHYDEFWVGEKLPLLHDLLAVATLINEEVCKYESIYFSVPLQGQYESCTLRNNAGEGYFANVGIDINEEAFYRLFRENFFNERAGGQPREENQQ